MLYCRTCRDRFSERKGTPLFGSKLPEDKAVSFFRHLAERNGVRSTARLVGVNPNTVVRYSRLGGMLSKSTTSSWLFPPQTREVQFDEKWSFVYKKQEHCDPDNPADDHHGDWWDHMAIDPEPVGALRGARGADGREPRRWSVRSSSGRGAVASAGDQRRLPGVQGGDVERLRGGGRDHGHGPRQPRMVPEKVPPPGMNYATVEKKRRLGRVVEIVIRLVFGTMAAMGRALRSRR